MSRRSLLRLQAALSSCKHHKNQKRISSTGRVGHSLAITEPVSKDCPRLLRTAACLGLRDTALQEGSLLSTCQHLQQRRSFIGDGAPAKHHHERRLLGYSQKQLYDVVAAVEHYKEFVPWCQRSVILQRKPPDFVEAELEVGFKMFVERYSSQVYLSPPGKVLSKVSDSTLFDHLDTTWEFKGGPTPSTTWLSFDIDFAFKSPLYRQIASIFFDEVVKRMMNAFEARCKTLYGESSLQQKRKAHA